MLKPFAVAEILIAKEPNGRILRWINYLSSFNIEILHRNGKSNLAADYLSRHPINLVQKLSTDDYLKNIETQLKSKTTVIKHFALINDELFYRQGKTTLKVLMTLQELYLLLKFLHDQLGRVNSTHFYMDHYSFLPTQAVFLH